MSFYGDPQYLINLANRLRGMAADVESQGAGLANRAHTVQWESVTADSFRHEVDHTVSTIKTIAGAMLSAAQALSAHAATVQARIARIGAIERAVTSWLESTPDSALLLASAGLSHLSLPSPGDKEWLDIGERISRLGLPGFPGW